MMHRRTFFKSAALLPGLLNRPRGQTRGRLSAQAAAAFKLGAISDGFSEDLETALRIMQGYGISWVEIRNIWGKYNTEAAPGEVRKVKQLLDQYRFKCSVVDSALYKCVLPGTTAVASEADAYPYTEQMELLKRAMERAHAWGTDKVRGFTFWRVAEPATIFPRVGEELSKAAEAASSAGIRLVIENEEDCNAATGHELAALLKLAPARNLGYNWDVGNGYTRGEVSYPDGYEALDKRRIWHLHLKGVQCAPGLKGCRETFADKGAIDLSGQLRALRQIHYQGTMSLECEFSAPGLSHLGTTRRSMEGLLRVVNRAVA
jgi:sugar phosphate isomerase/epimerase